MRKDITKVLNKLMKNNLDPNQINISIKTNLNTGGWLGLSDPQESIICYSINIEKYCDEEFENKEIIGNCICYFIEGYNYATEELIDIRNVADSLSGDLLAAVSPVIDSNGQVVENYIGINILYVDHFYINPEFRGLGIGSLCFPMILNVLGREAGVITIIPCPTEDNGKDRIKVTDKRYNVIFKKMIEFYERFGFKKVDDVVWAQDTSLRN